MVKIPHTFFLFFIVENGNEHSYKHMLLASNCQLLIQYLFHKFMVLQTLYETQTWIKIFSIHIKSFYLMWTCKNIFDIFKIYILSLVLISHLFTFILDDLQNIPNYQSVPPFSSKLQQHILFLLLTFTFNFITPLYFLFIIIILKSRNSCYQHEFKKW